MKRLVLVAGLVIVAACTFGAEKTAKNPLLASDTLVWAGLDYSQVRMIGPGEFRDQQALFPGMLQAWNDLFLQERIRFVEQETKTTLPLAVLAIMFAPPPNGITTNNTTTNLDGVLPFGEVFFRSAVFDPVRGYSYLGQDSRPNQIVKVKLAKDTPVITSAAKLPGGAFQFGLTFTPLPPTSCIAWP